jgi:hypothetical protein
MSVMKYQYMPITGFSKKILFELFSEGVIEVNFF